jgi:hypothetical protein
MATAEHATIFNFGKAAGEVCSARLNLGTDSAFDLELRKNKNDFERVDP